MRVLVTAGANVALAIARVGQEGQSGLVMRQRFVPRAGALRLSSRIDQVLQHKYSLLPLRGI